MGAKTLRLQIKPLPVYIWTGPWVQVWNLDPDPEKHSTKKKINSLIILVLDFLLRTRLSDRELYAVNAYHIHKIALGSTLILIISIMFVQVFLA